MALAVRIYSSEGASAQSFLFHWLALLAIAGVLNIVLLKRSAASRGKAMLTPEFWAAMKTICPAMLAAGLFGIVALLKHNDASLAACAWILGYGAALRATHSFSPRSIRRLGSAFLTSGIAFAAALAYPCSWLHHHDAVQVAALSMGATFGLLHMAYAIAVMLRPDHSAAEVGDHV